MGYTETSMRRIAPVIAALVVLLAAPPAWWASAAPVAMIDVKTTLAGVVLADDLVDVGERVEDAQVLLYVRTALTGLKSVGARAPRDGLVREVLVRPGQRVERGDVVVRIEPR